jgi:hypothetical protein
LDDCRQSKLLTAALTYTCFGWPVFPLHHATARGCSCHLPTCASPAKHPRTAHGFKDATTDEGQIRAWWKRWPQANIGIATGVISRLVVVDIDPRNGGHLTLEDLEADHGQLPETVESLTGGGGRHLLYRHPGEPYRLASDSLGPGVDLKADGGYIVVPPSLHVSGRRYEWEVLSNPGDTLVAPAPAWLPFYDLTEPHRRTPYHHMASPQGEGAPGHDYNTQATRAEVLSLLEAHGWHVAYRRGDVDYLCRPGKHGRACSATLGFVADTVLYLFSTNAPPFEALHAYDPFGIYARLEHDGDFTAAARALAALDYGERNIEAKAGRQSPSGAGRSPPPSRPYTGYRGYQGYRGYGRYRSPRKG